MTEEMQMTLKAPVHLSGVGLHSGQTVNIAIKPAPVNHWFKFVRTDVEGHPMVDALADHVVDTSRGTTLESKGARVATVEHVLSALLGMGIDNALIEVDGPEMPIMDGSARVFVEAIEKVGMIQQDTERHYFEIPKDYCFVDPDHKVEEVVVHSRGFKLSVLIDYEQDILPLQLASLHKLSDFSKEVAPCRTFVFLHELEFLIQNNLVKGGDLDNAIVFVNKPISEEQHANLAKFFNKPGVKVLKEGILNNLELHFDNEPARHKLLDLIGDLALIGSRIKGHVIAHRPGHQSNVAFAKVIRSEMLKLQNEKHIPILDPNAAPLFDINQIKGLLPHRPPFLLIDKIIEMSPSRIVGVKNVTMNEDFFRGHFPDKPVMPGVLIVEAMAQTGGILALSSVPDPENYLTFFAKLEEVKFRQQVSPGDTLIFCLELITPIRRGLVNMRGLAYVGKTLVCEATMLAQLSKKKSE